MVNLQAVWQDQTLDKGHFAFPSSFSQELLSSPLSLSPSHLCILTDFAKANLWLTAHCAENGIPLKSVALDFLVFTFIYLEKVSQACLLFSIYALLNIHGRVAHIHAWEQLATAAVFNCWPPSGSSGAAEVKCLTQGHLDKSSDNPTKTSACLLLFNVASCKINKYKYLREWQCALFITKKWNEKLILMLS